MNKLPNMLNKKSTYENFFLAVVLISFFIWLTNILIIGYESLQFNRFFGRCENFFADFINIVGYAAEKDPYNNPVNGLGEKAYPPLSYVIINLFSKLVNMDDYNNSYLSIYKAPEFLIIFVIVTVAIIIFGYEIIRSVKNGTDMKKRLIAAAVIFSAPMVFSLERGNTIVITSFLVLFFVFGYNSENKVIREISLIMIAIAATLKITPVVFGMLLVYDKKWKELIRTVIYGIVFTMAPFLMLKGGIKNIIYFIRNVFVHLSSYKFDDGCTMVGYFISFLNRNKACLIISVVVLLLFVLAVGVYFFKKTNKPAIMVSLLGIYAILCLAYIYLKRAELIDTAVSIIKITTSLFCCVLLISGFVSKIKWKIIMSLCIVVIMLPSHSGYYNLLYLIPALISFLNEEKHDKKDLLVLFAMIIIFSVYYIKNISEIFDFHLGLIIILMYLLVDSALCLEEYFVKNSFRDFLISTIKK